MIPSPKTYNNFESQNSKKVELQQKIINANLL